MAMSMLNSGPKLDWTRDNQMFLRYKKWRSKVELIFRSALSKATPEEKTPISSIGWVMKVFH